ncbi:MAG: capsular biosynthesis protein [Pseudomonadota bacterium]|jgi:capsular polysaccharide export protein|nr:capsular biosynthesis protein [Pseudomonadota bacterium]
MAYPESADRKGPARRFLFLQSLATPFFRRLGRELARRGYDVQRINLCLGDELFWNARNATAYRGRFEDWAPYIRGFLTSRGITDVVLFGDCRPYHKVAAEAARELGVRLHVFEDGYTRPNWIICEAGGINGYSSFPTDPDEIRRRAAQLPPLPQEQSVSGGFPSRVRWDLSFVAANVIGWPLYPRFRWHRPDHPLMEAVGWIGRLARRPIEKRRTARIVAEVQGSGRPYYVLPMQLDSDYQIRVHSPFKNLAEILETVVASFARSAPPDAILLAKLHPLDNGLVNHRGILNRLAERHGIADRVRLIDGGDLNALLAGAEGTVLVNSTVGTSALAMGSPLIALGKAIYDVPGLTFQGPLDAFWTGATKPDPELFEAFRRLLIHWSQVNGSYFTSHGIKLGIAGCLQRLQADNLPQEQRWGGIAEMTDHLLPDGFAEVRA